MSRMSQGTGRAGAKAPRLERDPCDREEGGWGCAGTMPHGAGGGGVLAWRTLRATLVAGERRVFGCGWSSRRGEALPSWGPKRMLTLDLRSLIPAVTEDESWTWTASDILTDANVTWPLQSPFELPCE